MENMTKVQNVILENRNRLNITGVVDVLCFDEQIISMVTEMGLLVVKGTDLHLNNYSLDSTELGIEGTINSLQYSDKGAGKNKEKLLTKIFK
jgi:sporulation protein YabP